jgi:hypothetical protein
VPARASDESAAHQPSATSCAQLESVGLYHRHALDGMLGDLERVRRWLVASDPVDLEDASAAAAALDVNPDIFALRLGEATAQADFRAWLAALAITDFSTLPPSSLLARVASQASTALVSALETCVARPGFHLWTETTLDPAVLEVHARHAQGAQPSDAEIDRLVAEGPDGSALDCTPELPRTRRIFLVRRPPTLEDDFAATCLRADPLQPAEIRIELASGGIVRVVPPSALGTDIPGPPVRMVPPHLACADPETVRPPSSLRVTTECAASTGDRSRRSRRHSGWNSRAEARSLCPHRDLDAEARASLLLRCRPQDDGSIELLVSGELTAHAGWNRRGCVVDDSAKTHCPATARIEGEAATALWVDLTSRHCLRVTLHKASGTGEPANNGSRKFGPERFSPRYLRLRDPHGTTTVLDADSELPLDVPGYWEIVAGGDAGRMPSGWRHRATRNQGAGAFRFRQRLRLQFPEVGEDGTCGPDDATGSAP